MKNHGAEVGVTNKYIPDNGNFIWRGDKNSNTDVKFSDFKKNLVADLGISDFGHNVPDSETKIYPKPGFQNAPAFSENTDKSLGTYSFNVPENLEAGVYTFVWEWRFNGPADSYVTCFEVKIVHDKRARDAELRTRGASDLGVICGGLTSGGSGGSTVGCADDVSTTTELVTDESTTDSTATEKTTTTEKVTKTPKPELPNQNATNETPTSTTEQPTTTLEPITSPHNSQIMGHVMVHSMSGEIKLPIVEFNTKRRLVKIQFQCSAVDAQFWFVSGKSSYSEADDKFYVLEQEEGWQLENRKIGYHFEWKPEACDILAFPVISVVEDFE